MRGDLLALLLLLLVVSVEPGPAPELRAWSRLKRVLNHLLSLDTAEEKAEGGDDSQDVPGQDYQVLRSFEGYEERKYPRLNYACTKMTYDIPRETEPWGVWGVITTLISDNMAPSEPRPQSTMFRRLFRYIRGENRLGQTMEMTAPIWTKLVVSEEEGQIASTMCVPITRQFQSSPPDPLEPEVKIVRSNETVVFVKEFGGFAMQDWVLIREAEAFRAELGEKRDEVELDHFWSASYDSPIKLWNRKNEVAWEKI